MTPQEIALFVPQMIYVFCLSLFDLDSLGYVIDRGCIFIIALLFWLKMGEALLAILKKLFGFYPKRG